MFTAASSAFSQATTDLRKKDEESLMKTDLPQLILTFSLRHAQTSVQRYGYHHGARRWYTRHDRDRSL
jgi:hypothetical protein